MTILGSFLRSDVENPAKPLTDTSLVGLMGGELVEAGVQVSHETAYRMAAVYRAHSLLAGLMGAMPLKSYIRREDGSRERVGDSVLDDPNPDKTQFEFWEFAGLSLLSHGNAYVRKVRDGLGRVREIWNLHPRDVTVERESRLVTAANPSGKRFWIGGQPFTDWDILHIPGMSYDGTVGLSPIQMARQGIGINIAAQRFASRMFGRGALTQGVLQTDKALEREDAEKLRQQWASKTSGEANQWRIPVLDSGAKYQPISLPPADAQYIEVRKFEVREIATLYGLPPHLLADVERSTSWGSGIEQQNLQLLTFTFDPFLVRAEQRISKELAPQGTNRTRWYARFERKALLRADTQARYLAYQRAIQNSLQSADEIRELEEMPPVPGGGGEIFWHPSNLEHVPGTLPDGMEEDDDE